MERRIVSLVPSLSETVCDLGLRSELVACTKFCIEPPDLHRSVASVGGTKDFDVDAVLALKPTHILCNQEENPKEPVERLMAAVPTLVTFPKSPSDVPEMLRSMGQFLDAPRAFDEAAGKLETAMRSFQPLPRRRFLYFIWRNPYMIAGRDTYISRFLELWGWENQCQHPDRYPTISPDAIAAGGADILLFSSEPFPFRKRDAERLRSEIANCPPIHRIDGQMLSWFGTRTMKAWRMMEELGRHGLPPL